MQTRHSPLSILGLAAILTGLMMPADAQEDPAPGDDFVRCRQCDDKGRMACGGCDGKGKLYKTCTQCGGSGRRPCRQCNKPDAEEPNEAGPGRINCGYCGGDGKFGARDKRCPRCGGDGSYACPSCRGKGHHKCKTELPAGICPTCRFTGKATCNICYGKLWIRRKPNPVKPREKIPAVPKEEINAGSLDPEALLLEAQGRFDSLTAIQTREKEIDTGELRRSCERAMMVTKGFLSRLERIKDKPGGDKARALYSEVQATQKKMRSLKSDLFDLGTLLLEFEKAYRRCEARIADRPRAPFLTTKKKKELKTWYEAISISFKANEKLAGELAEGEVFLAGKTSGIIEEDLNLIDNRIQTAEAADATARDPEEVERPSEKPEKTESPASQGNEKTAPGKTPAGPETEDAREEPTQSSSATAPEDEAGSSGGGLLMGVLWSLGGAIAGAGGLLFYLRKKHYF